MIYIPEQFFCKELSVALEIAQAHPFTTLVSWADGQPLISHLPLVTSIENSQLIAIGHLANRNPHLQFLKNTYVIYQGPQCYITPVWYAKDDVPTWNYAVVHAEGTSELITDRAGITKCIGALTEMAEKFHEKKATDQEAEKKWKFWIPEDLAGEGVLEQKITGFKIRFNQVQTKLKLSQNRGLEDHQGVLQGLAKRKDDMSQGVRRMMIALNREDVSS